MEFPTGITENRLRHSRLTGGLCIASDAFLRVRRINMKIKMKSVLGRSQGGQKAMALPKFLSFAADS